MWSIQSYIFKAIYKFWKFIFLEHPTVYVHSGKEMNLRKSVNMDLRQEKGNYWNLSALDCTDKHSTNMITE